MKRSEMHKHNITQARYLSPHRGMFEYYVSYAWDDGTCVGRNVEHIVDILCAKAKSKGVTVIRDKNVLRNGKRISTFIQRLGRGDRIYIILTDGYLKSAYCMREMFDVWLNCRHDDTAFIEHTRVFVHPSAKINTIIERAQYVKHWRKIFDEIDALVKQDGLGIIGEQGLAEYRWMQRFVSETANILELVQDVLRPRNFQDFLNDAFL